MTNCKNKSKTQPQPNQPDVSTENYCSSCPSQPEFVEEKKTCHPLTSHVTPSFLHAKESRTAYDHYWLHYYNQHAKNMDYDLAPLIESYTPSPVLDWSPTEVSCSNSLDCSAAPGNLNACIDGICNIYVIPTLPPNLRR